MFLESLFVFFGMATAEISLPRFDLPYVEAVYVEDYIKLYEPVPEWVKKSCIDTAKWLLTGKTDKSWGDASSLKPVESVKPRRGVILITNEGNSHVGVISSVSGDYMHIKEGNYYSNMYSERELRIDDPIIKGFMLPPL